MVDSLFPDPTIALNRHTSPLPVYCFHSGKYGGSISGLTTHLTKTAAGLTIEFAPHMADTGASQAIPAETDRFFLSKKSKAIPICCSIFAAKSVASPL
jgi:hypothetical protein